RRLTECLGRDRTKHQVAEVTSLGLVQMTRKRVGQGLLEAFSEPCPTCGGRGLIVHTEPVDDAKRRNGNGAAQQPATAGGRGSRRSRRGGAEPAMAEVGADDADTADQADAEPEPPSASEAVDAVEAVEPDADVVVEAEEVPTASSRRRR